jgi:hypothetical protein
MKQKRPPSGNRQDGCLQARDGWHAGKNRKTAVAGRLPQNAFWQKMSRFRAASRKNRTPVTDAVNQALGASAAAGASGAAVVT